MTIRRNDIMTIRSNDIINESKLRDKMDRSPSLFIMDLTNDMSCLKDNINELKEKLEELTANFKEYVKGNNCDNNNLEVQIIKLEKEIADLKKSKAQEPKEDKAIDKDEKENIAALLKELGETRMTCASWAPEILEDMMEKFNISEGIKNKFVKFLKIKYGIKNILINNDNEMDKITYGNQDYLIKLLKEELKK